jgi:hypothetical protein
MHFAERPVFSAATDAGTIDLDRNAAPGVAACKVPLGQWNVSCQFDLDRQEPDWLVFGVFHTHRRKPMDFTQATAFLHILCRPELAS